MSTDWDKWAASQASPSQDPIQSESATVAPTDNVLHVLESTWETFLADHKSLSILELAEIVGTLKRRARTL